MNRLAIFGAAAASLLLLALNVGPASAACNDAVCGSIVSKCTLLQSCNCTIEEGEECTCCKRCQSCLEPLYTECCSCFEGFCPQRPNVTQVRLSMSQMTRPTRPVQPVKFVTRYKYGTFPVLNFTKF